MLNSVYRLVRPRQFELAFEETDLSGGQMLVRPTHLSICHADQRYYQGTRPQAVLDEKLPMALIHEGIGRVMFDTTGTFQPGERVVMIPNVPSESDPVIGENYLRSSRFRGSSMDGFMQEYVATVPDRCVSLPGDLPDTTAAFTEMVSVCYHAVSRFDRFSLKRKDAIGVWGDGNMGYITALLLRVRYPDSKILVFGKNENKLSDFTFADGTYQIGRIPADLMIDHAIECVGGTGAPAAIAQIVDHISPEGTIALTGVSEDPVLVPTRMVLEKGLRLFGTSRSGREDFTGLLELYKKHPRVPSYLSTLIGGVVPVRSVADARDAFEMDIHKIMGKTIMEWM